MSRTDICKRGGSIALVIVLLFVHVPPAFAVLPTPTLLNPENNSWTNDNTPSFRWTSVEGADSYQILVDNDPDFSSPEVNEFPAENQYTPSAELPEGTYYWKVRARNSVNGDTSYWTAPWVFGIDLLPPPSPSLLLPEDGETLYLDQPTFSWTPVTDPTGVTYRLEIDNDPNFSTPVYSKLLTTTSHQPENKLVENFSPYYWRVVAIDGAQNENASTTRYFNLKVPPSSWIEPISPYWKNAAFILTASASDNDGTVENVEFWYRYSPDNTNWGDWILYDNDSTHPYSWTFAPSDTGFYQFYSRAWDDRGNYENAPEEADACCGYDNVPPPQLENLLPENGAELESPTVNFTWSGVSDLSGVAYEFVLDNENLFDEPHLYENTLSENWLSLALELGEYYWKVRAVDGAGNAGQWSSQHFFVRRWIAIESWECGLSTVTEVTGWSQLDTYADEVVAPHIWIFLEGFSGAACGWARWGPLEELLVTCTWPASWFMTENWLGSAKSIPSWRYLEGIGAVGSIPSWLQLDSSTLELRSPVAWRGLESLQGILHTLPLWGTVEALSASVNSPVPPPANLSPENGLNTSDNTPTLSWENLQPADNFELQVDTDWSFSSPEISVTLPGTQLSYTTSPLPDNLYWWRVRQFRTGTPSSWSMGYFRVDTIPPGAPSLIFPMPGSSINDNTPLFRWTSVPENSLPLTYWLQLDNEPAFNEPFLLSIGWLPENQFQFESQLPDGVYYWRIKIRDNAGWTGAWSSGGFRVDTANPQTPEPLSPISGEWTTPTPTLRWESVTDISQPVVYKVWICESSSFNPGLYTIYESPWIQENFWTSPVLEEGLGLEGKIFYWRVCALDNAGNLSDNSATQYFRTDNIPPTQPTLLSPENSSFVQSGNVLLKFSATDGSGELSYWVQVYLDQTLVYENEFVSENQLLICLAQGTYWWRVRARDAAGNPGIWSEDGWFTACTWLWVDERTSSLHVSYGWSEFDVWTGAVTNRPPWIPLDSWTLGSGTVPRWGTIEGWVATSITSPVWTEVEGFAGSFRTVPSYCLLENWWCTVSSSVQWRWMESVSGLLNFPSVWLLLEQVTSIEKAGASWICLEQWEASTWYPPRWREADTWIAGSKTPADWGLVELGHVSVCGPSVWRWLDSWGGGARTSWAWAAVDILSATINVPSNWLLVEPRSVSVAAPAVWGHLDNVQGSVSLPVPAPVPVSPQNGENINPNLTPLVLTWENLQPADNFDLQIDNDPDFSSPLIVASLTSTQYQPTGLTDNLYWWKVRQWRSGTHSEWSAVWRFRVDTLPPSRPSPLSPADGENLNDPTPLLRWTVPPENSLPLSYLVQISLSKYFDPPVLENWVSENCWEVPPLSENLYYWRVLARDNAGNTGQFSPARSFRVDTSPPNIPTPISPENNAWVTATPTLRWSSVTDISLPVRYNILIAYNPSFTLLVENLWTTENQLSIALGEGTYWWKVRAWDNAGNPSGWSDARKFMTDNTPPSQVQLLSPDNHSSLQAGPVTFTWLSATDAESGVSGYWLQLWSGETLIHENQQIVDNFLTLQITAESYWWRVRAVDVAGNLGEWSASWIFDACQWRIVESWSGGTERPVQWNVLDTLASELSTAILWREVESIHSSSQSVCLWRELDGLAGSTRTPGEWIASESWIATLTNLPSWRYLESWQCGTFTYSWWFMLESWLEETGAPVHWNALEGWPSTILVPAIWREVEYFTAQALTFTGWASLESWFGGAQSPVLWIPVETRLAVIRSPAQWKTVEGWTASLFRTTSWLAMEGWSGGSLTVVSWEVTESWQMPGWAPVGWIPVESSTSTILLPSLWRVLESRFGQLSAPLYPPDNLSPENGLNTSDNTPTLSWENLQPADNFELQVDTDGSFSSPEISVTLPGTQLSYDTPPLPDSLYWWRVRCYRTGTPGEWSEVRTFRIDTLKPAPPELLSPSDGQDVNDPTPLLRWTVPPENSLPLTYCLRISNSPYFEPENIVIETWVSDNAHEVSGLQENVTYYWKVCAADNAGNVGNFQENAWRFKIDTVMPSAPSLLHPENNGWASAKPNLDWLPVPENSPPVLYRVEVSDFPNFINLTRVAEIYSDNWIVSPPLPVSTYYWRVKARDNAGNWGPWSTVWRFKVDIDPPSKPTLLAPENEAHVQAGQPFTLCYTASDVGSGVAQYTVQISDEPNFYLPQVDVTVGENTHVAPGLAWGTYYWRIRAIDNVGNVGSWSDPFILYSSDWLPLDSSTVTVRGRAGWVSTETWLSTLSSPSTWHFVDSWAYELENLVAGWFWMDELSASGIGVHYWATVEGWTCSVKGVAGWRGIEVWSSSLRSYPEAFWRELENWSATSRAWAAWDVVESWLSQLYSEASWAEVDVLTASCTGVHYWVTLESWTGSVVNRQWRTLESWKPKVRAPASFKQLESLSWSVGVPPSEWSLCESLRAGGRGTLGSWKTLEALTARSLPARWRILDSAAGRIQTTACWRKIDNRSLTLKGPSTGYLQLDSRSGRISAPHIWVFIESLSESVSSPIRWKTIIQSAYLPKFGWFGLESWGGSIFAPRFLEERVTRTVEALTSQMVELTNLSPSLNRFWYRSLPPSARVSVAESKYLPPWLPKLPAELYVYLDLILENGVPLRMRIEVEKSWLQQMNRDTLKVWGYSGGWAELSYSLAGEDGRSLYLEFEPSGYSCFAVTAKRAPTFPTWVILWVWLGIIGTIGCVMMYPAASEFWARRTQRKLMRIIEAPSKEIDRRLRSYGRKLHRRERTDLARLAEELIAPTPPPPKVIPVLEKLTKPELVAVETLKRFMRERRGKMPLGKREVEELRKLQEKMKRQKGRS